MYCRTTSSTFLRCTAFPFAFTLLLASTNDAHSYQWKQTCDDNNRSQNKCERDETPLPIKWEQGCLTFGLENSPSSARELAARALSSSFDAWNQVACSGMSVRFDANGSYDNNVRFEKDDWEHSRTSFAVTAVSYAPDTGEIANAEIRINEANYDFEARASGPSPDAPDLQNTVTHEVGHALGFAHSDVRAATMFGGASTGETDKRSLHTDDIDGLCQAYAVDSFQGACETESGQEQHDSKGDEPSDANDEFGGWGGGSADSSANANQPACSVTTSAGSAKLPIGSLLLFIVLSLLVKHGASIGAVRTRRRPRGARDDSDR